MHLQPFHRAREEVAVREPAGRVKGHDRAAQARGRHLLQLPAVAVDLQLALKLFALFIDEKEDRLFFSRDTVILEIPQR